MSSELPDTASFRAWLVPAADAKIKTVCIAAQRAPDPQATGTDADTATCRVFNNVQAMTLTDED